MAAVADFERLVESLVERSLIAPLRGRVQPIEIAKRLQVGPARFRLEA